MVMDIHLGRPFHYTVQSHRSGSKTSREPRNFSLPQNACILSYLKNSGSVHKFSGVFAIRCLRADMRFSAGGEQFKMKYVWQSLKDWKTYIASKLSFRY